MSTDHLGQQLHDRATRGEVLSVEEQAHLQLWYARQDQEESGVLAGAPSDQSVAQLRGRLDAAVSQLVEATQRIQVLAVQNEAVRREIADLERQLTQRA